MKKKTIFTIFVVFLLFFSLFNQVVLINVLAQEKSIPEKPRGLLQRLGKFLASWIVPIFQLFFLSGAAEPPVVEISYNESVNVEVGMIDIDTNTFEYYDGSVRLEKERYLTFEVLEYPSGNEYGNWQVTFNPPVVNVINGTVIKTNVTIKLRSNRLTDKPIQSGVLKIQISHIQVFGNINRPPKGFPFWDKPIFRSFWTFLAVVFPGWGKYFNGKVLTENFTVDILVKVKPVHQVNFYSVPYKVFKPDEVLSIPITLQNLGNYNDTYTFKVIGEKDEIKYAEPTSITLAPGEIRDSYLGLIFPPTVFDYGTIHKIKIQVYSIYDENTVIAERTVILESKGVYFSEISSFGIILFIFTIIIIVLFFYLKRKRSLDDICIKPNKPWEIPEEKEYLDQLKQIDEQKYNEELNAMKDEYKSALLWYKYYIKSVTKPKPLKKEPQKKVEKILIKKEVNPVKKKKEIGKIISGMKNFLIKKEVKPAKKTKDDITKKKKKTDIIFDLKVQDEKLKKERVLKRIKNEQEKQKRKLDKLRLSKGG